MWEPPSDPGYAYLLGMYLGDGCLVRHARAVELRITLDAGLPGVVAECRRHLDEAFTPATVHERVRRGERTVDLAVYGDGLPVAFPQHGPGRKHERPIVLQPWQQAIVDAHPGRFVRGLIHSDGARCVNRFTTTLPSGRVAEYAYPRYFFSNLSPDIRGLFRAACERLGVRVTQSNARNLSVAHRASVAVLDEHVGPKR